MNGRNTVNGVTVHKHVQEENNHVQDLSRLKQKMVEIPVLGMQLRPNPAIQTRVQVSTNGGFTNYTIRIFIFFIKNNMLRDMIN